MTLEQRAQQFWSVLAFAAREQKVVSYLMLAQITGFADTGIVLYYISCYCQQHKLPPLNVIVMDPVTGQPGGECPCDLRELSAQQSRVFLYDWLNHPAPSEEMFKEAAVKDEEVGKDDVEYLDVPCRC